MGMGMVTSVTSFGRSGLYDWLIQRVGGVVMAAYTVFIVGYLICNPNLSYEQWQSLFGQLWVRVFSLATLLSFISHAWIGLWAVLTDYLTTRLLGSKATFLRVLAQLVLGGVSLTYLVWGVQVIWSIN
jgi:succinate dehydrogenase / fumarate reductase membrane anchor subunit